MSIYKPQSAYIVSSGSFLPNKPVDNDSMEKILGLVNGKPSRYRRRILQSNGIKQRYYALNESGEMTHLTEELAALSIQNALAGLEGHAETLDLFAIGTTLPDLLAPGIASMVHGRIGGKHADVLSTAGICGAGAAAMKAAVLSVISGQHQRVVACGTERPSALMRGCRFDQESEIQHDGDVAESFQYFHADFLRWMLSDGAGSVIIDNKPRDSGLSLKVEWIETSSYANELPTCMYMGAGNPDKIDANQNWIANIGREGVSELSFLLLRQDTKILAENIVDIVVDFAVRLKNKFGLTDIDWFLPHISSYFFHEKLAERLAQCNINIPMERWYTNLATKGNTGAASIFIMLDELLRSGNIQDGQKLLLMVPESGRFSVTYALLSAQEH